MTRSILFRENMVRDVINLRIYCWHFENHPVQHGAPFVHHRPSDESIVVVIIGNSSRLFYTTFFFFFIDAFFACALQANCFPIHNYCVDRHKYLYTLVQLLPPCRNYLPLRNIMIIRRQVYKLLHYVYSVTHVRVGSPGIYSRCIKIFAIKNSTKVYRPTRLLQHAVSVVESRIHLFFYFHLNNIILFFLSAPSRDNIAI